MEASLEDTNQAAQPTAEPSCISSGLERGPSGEEDPTAMTIDFLRARLLSERSVSKAARERGQQLAQKVIELEERLQAEIELRKKLEAGRLEILAKCRAELGDDHGDFFTSPLEESFSRDETSLDSPPYRKHDANEQILSCDPDESGKGLLSSKFKRLDRSDSSPQLSREEGDDRDDITNYSGQEKGVLSWGRQKGLRRELTYGTDWIGRSFCSRSRTSNDGEAPHKKWIGKSVRQIRKRGSRSDVNDGENEPNQSSEECDSKTGHQNAMKNSSPCDDERDTEVERVLEQQAEFIGQHEDEEKAQRAWEAKYTEGKVLSNFDYGKVITPSNSGSRLDVTTIANSEEQGSRTKDGAAQQVGHLSIASNESVTKNFSNMNPEAAQIMSQERALQSQPGTQCSSQDSLSQDNLSQDNYERPIVFESNAAGCSQADKVGVSISDQKPPTEKSADCSENCEVEGLSHHEGSSSSMNAEPIVELGKPAVEGARKSKLKRHLSSSFRFSVLPDAEPASETSPPMYGFTISRPNDRHDEDTSNDLGESNGAHDVSVFAGSHNCDADDHPTSVASVDNHVVARDSSLIPDCPPLSKDTESQGKKKDMFQENFVGQGRQRSQIPAKNNSAALTQDVNSSNSSAKDGGGRPTEVPESEHDLSGTGRHYSELPSYVGSEEYLQQGNYGNLPRVDDGFQSSKGLYGANLDNNDLCSGTGMKSGFHVGGLHAFPTEERALGSHRRSFDGLDRVADVLRVLEIAKLQIQSSNEQGFPSTSDRSDYHRRDADPLKLSSIYATPSQTYAASEMYSSRGPATYFQNLNGWGDLSSGYGLGLTRQMGNGPYIHYPSRTPEAPSLRPSLPSNTYNSNMYQYDFSQHR